MTTQAQLVNKLDKFKMALEYAPVSVFIMDKNWNFEYINPEFERLSGFTGEELLNRKLAKHYTKI